MRKMMIAISAAVTLLTAGSAAAQAALASLPAASPACGTQCFDLSSLVLGTHAIQNAYIPRDNGTGGRIGRPVNLRHATNTRANEDFTGAQVGTLGDYCGNHISAVSYACVNYPGSYPVFESDWSPFGNQTSLCVGVARAVSGEHVTLQRCGATGRTLWVGDLRDAVTVDGSLYTPWVNGADPNFSHPLVLTVNPGSFLPQNVLKLRRLNLLDGGTVADSQEFTIVPGPAA